jgi:hypothetical protein
VPIELSSTEASPVQMSKMETTKVPIELSSTEASPVKVQKTETVKEPGRRGLEWGVTNRRRVA